MVQPRADEPSDPNDTVPLDELDAELDDAYAEGELAEVDGVYDIVPSSESGLDVLYDMLSSFDEDSVQIYAGTDPSGRRTASLSCAGRAPVPRRRRIRTPRFPSRTPTSPSRTWRPEGTPR